MPDPTHPVHSRRQRQSAVARPLAVLLVVAAAASSAQPGRSRLQPPVDAQCPRDHLTLYAGVVQRFRRSPGLTQLRIRTDWDTTETVTLRHPNSDDPSSWFLIQGQPFGRADWARIEERPGRLRPGTRAAAWVCDDGRNPVVDWNPPREG